MQTVLIWVRYRTIQYFLRGVFVGCNLFFYLRKKTIFLRWKWKQILPSLLCTLPFGRFPGQHIFHQFRQQTFVSALIFNKRIFSDFCGDKLFFHFQSPPPPRYQMVHPLDEQWIILLCSPVMSAHFPISHEKWTTFVFSHTIISHMT